MEIRDYTCLPFNAKLGPRALRCVNNEFGRNEKKLNKFLKLFDDTFSKSLDNGTIINIDRHKRYTLSHSLFPDIVYNIKDKPTKKRTLAQTIINECPRVFMYGEKLLFQHIVRQKSKDTSFDVLEELINTKITNSDRKILFLETISLAKKIREENPTSKLQNSDFSAMENKILQEQFKDPESLFSKLARALLEDKGALPLKIKF